MAITSRSTLASQILSLLADNTSGDISAADMRTILTNLTDSIDHISEGGSDLSLEASIKLSSTKGNQYNLNGSARTGDLTIDSSVVRLGIAIIRHNDSSVPAVSITGGGTVYFPAEGVNSVSDMYTVSQDNYFLLTCTDTTAGALKVAMMPWAAVSSGGSTVSFVDNSDGTFTLTIDGSDYTFDANQAQAPQASTLPIEFDILGVREYGTPAAPITSALTFDMTDAVDGAKAVVWYQAASDPFDPYPTVAGQQIRKFGGEAFGANLLMRYEFEYDLGTTTIAVKPFRQDTSPPTLSGLAVSNSSPPTNGTNMTLTYTYAQAESVAENTSAALFEWWEADTAGELDEADIVAGTPTLVKSATGDATYNPSTDGKYVRGRVRVFTTDSSASGSDWAYTSVLGPVVASAAFDPLSNTSTLLWYDFTDAAGGTVGALADHWEEVINKADGTGETDYVQTSTANQGSIADQATNFDMDLGTSGRYQAGSWTRVADLVADEADRTVYALVRFPSAASLTRFMYLGNGRQVWFETNTGYVQINSSSLKTVDGSIGGGVWTVLKMRYVHSGVTSSVEVLTGAQTTPNIGTQNSSATGIAEWFNSSNNSFDLNNNGQVVEWRHLIVADGTLQGTGTEESDIESWLATQAAL